MKTNQRNTNLELFRIIVMLSVIAHHYVLNSGLVDLINDSPLTGNSIFLLLFGAWGKTAINCFVLITGYFMCKSDITGKKFLKLFLELEFYKIVIYGIFVLSGYEQISISGVITAIVPFTAIKSNFTGCFLVFYLIIPFLNILIQNMSKKQHMYLIAICVFIYSIVASIPRVEVNMNYITWFIVLYFIASYIRCYPNNIIKSKSITGILLISTMAVSCISIIVLAYYKPESGVYYFYHFLFDSNKFLALVTAVSAFMFFNNIELKYNAVINRIASSAFGVLLIHSNSDTMREWLWGTVLKPVNMYNSQWLVLHAFGCIIGIYAVCTIIDQVRISALEKPLLKLIK